MAQSRVATLLSWLMTNLYDQWKALTRLFRSALLAFDAEIDRWEGLPLDQGTPLIRSVVRHAVGPSVYRANADVHLETLRSRHLFLALILLHSCALTEAHAAHCIAAARAADPEFEKRLAARVKSKTAQSFDELVDLLLARGGIEAWGEFLLSEGDYVWADVLGGRKKLVEAFTLRNAIAHGQTAVTSTMLKRVDESTVELGWAEGKEFVLDFRQVHAYRRCLLSFWRLIERPRNPLRRPREKVLRY